MITKIKIHGYRIYKKFELAPNQKLNLIVGANEAGKSTLIEALTLALTGWIDQERRSIRHERLFPHLPNSTGLGFGRQLSRQFSTYIKAQGVSEEGMGLHAFRHTFATLLDKVGNHHRYFASDQKLERATTTVSVGQVLHPSQNPTAARGHVGEVRAAYGGARPSEKPIQKKR